MDKIKSSLLPLGVSFFALLVIISDVLNIPIFGIAITIYFVGLLILLPYQSAIKALFFLMPFSCGITGFTVFLSIWVIIFKSKHINIWQIVPAVIIALLEVFKVAYYQFAVNYNTVISYIGFILLYFYTLFCKDDRVEVRGCIKYYCLATILTLIIVYINVIAVNGFESLIIGDARGGSAMGFEGMVDIRKHLVMNANTIAYYAIVLLTILLFGQKRLGFNKFLSYLGIIIATLAGLFSFSRTWLIMATILFFISSLNNPHRIRTIVLILITFFIIFISQSALVESIINVFEMRIEDETFKTGGGRFEIFTYYNKVWMSDIKYILTGTGATHYGQVIKSPNSIHNGMQQIWVCHGIIGFLVFITTIVHYFKRYRRRIPFVFYLPILACFIFDQSIQFLVPYSLMLPFIPALYILRLDDVIY